MNMGSKRTSFFGCFNWRKVKVAVLYLILAFVGILFVIPILWAVSASLKPVSDIFEIPVKWIPKIFQWKNYIEPFVEHRFEIYFLNSIMVGVIVTGSSLLFCSLAGYSLSKFRYPGRSIVFMIIVSTLMIPFEVVVIPLYLVVRDFGWVDTYWGLVVPAALTPFGVFLMRQFISTVPDEFMAVARIDGAREIRIFFQIILPLSRSALSTLTIFTFMASWNSFLWPLVIVNRDKLRTLPLGLAVFHGEYFTVYNQLMAVCIMAIFPILLLFLIMQQRVMSAMTAGGLKG